MKPGFVDGILLKLGILDGDTDGRKVGELVGMVDGLSD